MNRLYVIFCLSLLISVHSWAQRNCGYPLIVNEAEARFPGTRSNLATKRQEAYNRATQAYQSKAKSTLKTTTTNIIPVVFHFVIDSIAFKAVGGISGIEDRINSQLTALNNDYNANNADKIKIPSVWTSLYANIGITFKLAHIDPSGAYTKGYDIVIVPNGTEYDANTAAKPAKFSSTGGIDAWDNTRYLNIWVTKLQAMGGSVLGVTISPSLPGYTIPERGIAVHLYAFGVRKSFSEPYITNIDKGRTLTHEIGHYFNLEHTWGDDNGLCPGSGGIDDGIADTPPEADAIFGAPSFPLFDTCSRASSISGVMFMNYMDYTDDISMYMFTKDQATVMQGQLLPGGDSYTLTQHPSLGISLNKQLDEIYLYPNPCKEVIYIQFPQTSKLNKWEMLNLVGQKVLEQTESTINNIDVSGLNKGIYFVRLYFDNNTYTQKIIVE